MAWCWIEYRESAWLAVPYELKVKVNLTDLAQGRVGRERRDGFHRGEAPGKDITKRLATAELQRLYQLMRAVQIGFAAEPAMGCDGSDHELTLVFAPLCRITCRWWVEIPPEWRGVQEIVRILHRHAEPDSLYSDMGTQHDSH